MGTWTVRQRSIPSWCQHLQVCTRDRRTSTSPTPAGGCPGARCSRRPERQRGTEAPAGWTNTAPTHAASTHRRTVQPRKGAACPRTVQHGWILNTRCCKREATCRVLQVPWNVHSGRRPHGSVNTISTAGLDAWSGWTARCVAAQSSTRPHVSDSRPPLLRFSSPSKRNITGKMLWVFILPPTKMHYSGGTPSK